MYLPGGDESVGSLCEEVPGIAIDAGRASATRLRLAFASCLADRACPRAGYSVRETVHDALYSRRAGPRYTVSVRTRRIWHALARRTRLLAVWADRGWRGSASFCRTRHDL